MTYLEAFAPDVEPSHRLRIASVTQGTNDYGDFLRVVGPLADGTNACVFINPKHFDLFQPYAQRWREDPSSYTSVPVFKGRDQRWRFSANDARKEQGLLSTFEPSQVSYMRERPTIKGEIAERCRREAERRHLTVSELVMLLLDQALPSL